MASSLLGQDDRMALKATELSKKIAELKKGGTEEEVRLVQKELNRLLYELDPEHQLMADMFQKATAAHLKNDHEQAKELKQQAKELEAALRKRYDIRDDPDGMTADGVMAILMRASRFDVFSDEERVDSFEVPKELQGAPVLDGLLDSFLELTQPERNAKIDSVNGVVRVHLNALDAEVAARTIRLFFEDEAVDKANETQKKTATLPVRNFELNTAKAGDVVQVLNEQFAHAGKFTAETTTNHIYGRVSEEHAVEIEQFLQRLDDRAADHRDREIRVQEMKAAEAEAMFADLEAEQRKRSHPIRHTIQLKHIAASDVLEGLTSLGLLGESLAGTSAAERILLLRGQQSMIDEAKEVCQLLDVPKRPDSASPRAESAEELLPLLLEEAMLKEKLGPNHPELKAIAKRIEITQKLLTQTLPEESVPDMTDPNHAADLQHSHDSAEAAAHETAKQLRDIRTAKNVDEEALAATLEKLRRHVTEAFDARVRLQEAQLRSAERNLKAAHDHLTRRKQLAEKIISRRIEELQEDAILSWPSREL